jgi:drug/metabolite transporter (DMT)-like permease
MLAGTAAMISGVAVFSNGYGVGVVPDATVYTTAKNLVAAAILAVVAAVALRARRGAGTPRSDRSAAPGLPGRPARWGALAAIAVIGGSVPFVLFFEGLARASSGQAQFVHKTLIVWVALLAVPLLRERIGPLHLAAIGVLVAGQAMLGGGLTGFRLGGGELLVLAATGLWAVEVVVAKRVLRDVPAATVAVARMGAGVVLLVAWVAVTGRWALLAGLSAEGWGWAVLTGALLAGYVATWYRALALAPAVDVTAVLVLAVLVTGLLNAAVKGVPVTATTGAGLVLVGCGVGLAALAATRRAAPPLAVP